MMFSLSFVWGSKFAEGVHMAIFVSGLGPGRPYPLPDLDRGSKSKRGSKSARTP